MFFFTHEQYVCRQIGEKLGKKNKKSPVEVEVFTVFAVDSYNANSDYC